MGKIFTQTSNGTIPVDVAGCALAGAAAFTLASSSAEGGSPPAGIAKAVDLNGGGVNERAIIIEGSPGTATWAGGAWTVDINYSAKWAKALLNRIDIYRVTSGGVCTTLGAGGDGMIASLPGIGGVEVAKNPVVDSRSIPDTTAGAGTTGAATDKFRIMLFFDNGGGGGTTGEITFDQIITSPLANITTITTSLSAYVVEPEILETELPNLLTHLVNSSGALNVVNNGVDTPDGAYLLPTDNLNNYTFKLDFPTPSGALTGNLQTLRILARELNPDQTLSVDLYDGAVFKKALFTNQTLTGVATIYTATFLKTDLDTVSGAGVNFHFVLQSNVANRALMDEAEWVASIVPSSGATKTLTLEAAIQAQALGVSAAASGALQKPGQTQTATVAAVMRALGMTQAATVSAGLKSMGLLETTTLESAIKKMGAQITLTSDGVVVSLAMRTLTVGAALKRLGLSSPMTVGAALKHMSLTASATVGAAVAVLNKTLTATADVVVQKRTSATTTLSPAVKAMALTISAIANAALLVAGKTQTTTGGGAIQTVRQLQTLLGTGAVKKLGTLRTLAASPLVQKLLQSATTALDASITMGSSTVTATLNAAIRALARVQTLAVGAGVQKKTTTTATVGAAVKALLLNVTASASGAVARLATIIATATEGVILRRAARQTAAESVLLKRAQTATSASPTVLKLLQIATATLNASITAITMPMRQALADVAIQVLGKVEILTTSAALQLAKIQTTLSVGGAVLKRTTTATTVAVVVHSIKTPRTVLLSSAVEKNQTVSAAMAAALLVGGQLLATVAGGVLARAAIPIATATGAAIKRLSALRTVLFNAGIARRASVAASLNGASSRLQNVGVFAAPSILSLKLARASLVDASISDGIILPFAPSPTRTWTLPPDDRAAIIPARSNTYTVI